MNKIDFIFLIISSDNLACYKHMRDYATKYFSLYKTQIKHFFIEMKPDLECDICEIDNYIYVKGEENLIPGVYIKTMKTMKYINEKYDYDFIIRTNLSSFWNLNNVIKLKKNLPLNNFSGGHVGYVNNNTYISGMCIILSKDTCINLANNMNIVYELDDVIIGAQLQQLGYNLTHINQYYRLDLIHNVDNIIHINENDIDNKIYYYRIKNDDRNIDVKLFNILFDKIYGKQM